MSCGDGGGGVGGSGGGGILDCMCEWVGVCFDVCEYVSQAVYDCST